MMSFLHKRPASPSHGGIYVPSTKKPRLVVEATTASELNGKKRKHQDELCEACVNNKQAERAYYVKEILHNRVCPPEDEQWECSRTFRCKNCRAGKNTGHSGSVDEINPDIRPYKKLRKNPNNDMYVTYKDLAEFTLFANEKTDVDARFNSFNFWRPTLPDIESQLTGVLEETMDSEPVSSVKEEENPDFNSFNFWKLPLQDIDSDMELL